jgi:hypothetical protein
MAWPEARNKPDKVQRRNMDIVFMGRLLGMVRRLRRES